MLVRAANSDFAAALLYCQILLADGLLITALTILLTVYIVAKYAG